MRYLDVNLACRGNDKPFDFGYKGENIVTGVIFDYSSWRELYGVGALTLAVQPSGNSNPYPVTLTAIDDTHALWTLTKTDLNEEGAGRCQLTYAVGEAIKKSAVFVYKAGYSMDATGEIPDPYISYFEQILETGAQVQADAAAAAQSKADAETAAQDARASADEIENMTATAETLPAGSDATAEYSDGTLSLGIPQGAPGDEGPQGPPGPTGNGIQSTVLNADYTLTITFTNGSTYTTPSIRGPQGPDGETGPTGNGIQSTVLNSDYTLTITFTDGTTYTTPSIRGEQGEQGDPGVVQDVTVNGTSVLDGTVAKVVIPEITKTVTGNPIVIDDADGEVKALNVELAPIQEGTGTPSPTNIRPIYPHTSLRVRDTGKNLLPIKAYTNIPYNPTAGTAVAPTEKPTQWTDNGDGTFKMTLGSWEQAGFITPPLQAGKYTFKLTTVTAGMRISVYVVNADNTVNRISTIKNGTAANELFQVTTTLTDKQWFAVYLAGGSGECVIREPQLELGETATSYAPYTGQTANVPLNDLYGGIVGMTSGTGTETREFKSATWGDMIPTYTGTDFTCKNFVLDNAVVTGVGNSITNITDAYIESTTYQSAHYYVSSNKTTVFVTLPNDTPSDTVVQFCGIKETPSDLTTTPTPLTLYTGDNVISSDGDITLNYERNLQAVITSIEDRLSALEG